MKFIRGRITNFFVDLQKFFRASFTGRRNENVSKMVIFQNFGTQYYPPDNTECIALYDGDFGTIVSTDNKEYRFELSKGEIVFYADKNTYIKLTPGTTNNIELNTKNLIIKSDKLMLGGSGLLATSGVVTGECLCAFTGLPHADKSSIVLAKK